MEREIFNITKTILSNTNIDVELLELRENKTNVSLYYLSTMVFTIKISKKLKYLSFHIRHRNLFNETFNISQIESDLLHFRVNIDKPSDIFKMSEQLIEIFYLISIPITFDICSRYMQCSDEKKCVHPDKLHAKECSYRRKLQDGIVFYGKNRNI